MDQDVDPAVITFLAAAAAASPGGPRDGAPFSTAAQEGGDDEREAGAAPRPAAGSGGGFSYSRWDKLDVCSDDEMDNPAQAAGGTIMLAIRSRVRIQELSRLKELNGQVSQGWQSM